MNRQFTIDTSPRTWDDALKAITGGNVETPEPVQPKAKRVRTPKTPEQLAAAKERKEALQAKAIEAAAAAAKPTWRQRLANFITNRFRDLALASIVVAAFVAVFDGSFYSASVFSFLGWSTYAFALMPDALMVLSAAKMREQGITPTQHEAAHKAMRFGLWFSLFTNMIAAALRNLPALATWTVELGPFTMKPVVFVGSVVYHGVVVLILKHAVETLTKVRADRKGHNGSGSMNPIELLANVAKVTPKALGRKGSEVAVPAQRRGK